jgi:hypothetical protein
MYDRHERRYECTLILEGLDGIGEHERTRCRRLECRASLSELGALPGSDCV